MNDIVLVTTDSDFELRVKRALEGRHETQRFWDDRLPRLQPETAVAEIAGTDPGVVVLGPDVPTAVGLALSESFDLLRPEVCVVLVARPTANLWKQALRAGVREIVATTADDEEIRNSLGRAGAAASRRLATGSSGTSREPARRGRVVSVVSPKGGAGKTTVATNLAIYLAAADPGRVAIVDLDLQFGDIASALAIGPQSTIADAARAGDRLDSTTLKVLLEPHPSGLYALVAPHFPAEAEEVGATTVAQVLELLADEFDYVIVDTSAGLDEAALAAIEGSDDLVLVCVTDVPSVRGLRKALDVLDLLGMSRPRRHLVLNRSDDRVGLATRDIEATVGLTVEGSVPTSRSVQIAINQGSPVVASDARSAAAKALASIGSGFLDHEALAPDASRKRLSRKDRR